MDHKRDYILSQSLFTIPKMGIYIPRELFLPISIIGYQWLVGNSVDCAHMALIQEYMYYHMCMKAHAGRVGTGKLSFIYSTYSTP